MVGTLRAWDGAETTEKAQRALERLKETFKVESLPASLAELAHSESGINDLYMNLKRQLEGGKVEQKDKLLIAIGVATAAGSRDAVTFLGAAAREAGVTPQQIADAIGVATVCTLFNSYYKFRHLAQDEAFEAFKAPFNANSFMKTELSPVQTELLNIAISTFNGCDVCVKGHLNKTRALGVSDEQIDETIKVGAIATALAAACGAMSA
ncbi:MAG: lipoyl-dependent peroxiredoxin subunit [Candidatus Sumerlaeota bacterium]|nr:lipoyl-dependent peroxiredoxin subunit [Candidatus Sumerlaeota bacterium]